MIVLAPPEARDRVPGMPTPRDVTIPGTRTARRRERERVRRARLTVTVVTVATILGVVAGARLGVTTGAPQLPPEPAPVVVDAPLWWQDVTPEEDEPGWDCRTMGNRRCG